MTGRLFFNAVFLCEAFKLGKTNPANEESENCSKTVVTRRGGRVVDGSGLENRHTRKGIGGSNPSLSATQSGTQRNLASILAKSLEMAAISRILPTKWTGGSLPLYCAGGLRRPFLWRAHWQSGFKTP
jgi:hypothetical protein